MIFASNAFLEPQHSFPTLLGAAILFEVDGTLMDDDRAVLLALASFHSSYGSKLGISPERPRYTLEEIVDVHFARYLAGEISMPEQRRVRVVNLFASSKINLSPETADRVFAAYEADYRAGLLPFARVELSEHVAASSDVGPMPKWAVKRICSLIYVPAEVAHKN
jgi:hypothetical protein